MNAMSDVTASELRRLGVSRIVEIKLALIDRPRQKRRPKSIALEAMFWARIFPSASMADHIRLAEPNWTPGRMNLVRRLARPGNTTLASVAY